MADELADLTHDWAALGTIGVAAVACAHLHDVRRAEKLHAMLVPHGDRFVDTGPSWFGAATHHLAVLAGVIGRDDEADERFASTIEAYAGLGADAWLVRARLDWARGLLARRTPAHTRHARALLREAGEAAEHLGLPRVAHRAGALLAKA